MREVTLNVLDSHGAIHAHVHGSVADAVVAALSAEPETIDELQWSLGRFQKPRVDLGFFDLFTAHVCDEPWDAGIVIVDLPARLVSYQSTYSAPAHHGELCWHDGTAETDKWLPYRLPDDWLIREGVDSWRSLSRQRRSERSAAPPIDIRKVLYGKLSRFIVTQSASATKTTERSILDVHARWLTTPRDDLNGQAPRDVLLADREFIDRDLEHQARYWSLLEACPPGLSRQSVAYRLGGFGTHENILYYDLVRYLIRETMERPTTAGVGDREDQVCCLEQLQQEWMHTPHMDLDNHSPAQVIDRERSRLPMVESPGSHLDNCNCPLCQMEAEMPGLTFWQLNGCHMDDDFAFSFYSSREEWEAEQVGWHDRTPPTLRRW